MEAYGIKSNTTAISYQSYILEALKDAPKSALELSRAIKLPLGSMHFYVGKLIEAGVVVAEGTDRDNNCAATYRLADERRDEALTFAQQARVYVAKRAQARAKAQAEVDELF
jgi:DNA-binding IclR family transcriptional regulator